MMPVYLPHERAARVQERVKPSSATPEHGLPLVERLIVLLDPTTGQLLSLMGGVHITTTREAAASAVATRALANADASTLALVGARVQAGSGLEAMLAVRSITKVRVALSRGPRSTTPTSRSRPVEAVGEAVVGADLVCTISTLQSPVLRLKWLQPGCQVNAVRSHSPPAREIDTAAMAHARVAVDSREAALGECGDCVILIGEGLFSSEHVSDARHRVLSHRGSPQCSKAFVRSRGDAGRHRLHL